MTQHPESHISPSAFERAIQEATLASSRSLQELQVRLHLRSGVRLAGIKRPSLLTEEEVTALLKELAWLVPKSSINISAA